MKNLYLISAALFLVSCGPMNGRTKSIPKAHSSERSSSDALQAAYEKYSSEFMGLDGVVSVEQSTCRSKWYDAAVGASGKSEELETSTPGLKVTFSSSSGLADFARSVGPNASVEVDNKRVTLCGASTERATPEPVASGGT